MKHSIHYTNLPDWFIAYDIFDKFEGKFWSRDRLEKVLEKTTISMVPIIARNRFRNVEELKSLISTKSMFYAGQIEGIYIRYCDNDWLVDRSKIVRSSQ